MYSAPYLYRKTLPPLLLKRMKRKIVLYFGLFLWISLIHFCFYVRLQTGNTFVIKNQIDFAKTILPNYYKHNNIASFIRQLNMCK